MIITLSLDPAEEARLKAAARAKGVSADVLVREALHRILAEGSSELHQAVERPIWELIEDNMTDVPADEFAKLPVDGASEHDHYLYGHPNRAQ